MNKLILILLVTTPMFSQNDFIITNSDQKIDIEDSTVVINSLEKSIDYKLLDKHKSKSIDFEDLNYCFFENYVFMTYDLYKTNDIKGYFILADTPKRKLLSIILPPEADIYNKFNNLVTKYEFFIIDEDSRILEQYKFDNIKLEINTAKRQLIVNKIRNQFKDFPEFISKLDGFENLNDDKYNLKILELFEYPTYMKKVLQ
jgi:hypothetical protein